MTLLMALTGDMVDDEYELRALLARDEADDDRRNEVRRLWGEKRAMVAWKREGCILACGRGCSSERVLFLRVAVVGTDSLDEASRKEAAVGSY